VPEPTISTLREGDAVSGVFACVRKERLTTRGGAPYLALELRDRTGAIKARAFRDADVLASRFERGDVVQLTGTVQRFRDELVIDIADVAAASPGSAGAEASRFLPSTYRDMEELDGFLEHLSREVYDTGYRALLDRVLADEPVRAELRRAPATRAAHHAYLGGLLEHTVAVTTLARELCELHPRLNSDLLLCAAILHDIGRTREFTYGAEIGLTEEGRLLGHLAIGQQLLVKLADGVLDQPRLLALLHCVVSHNGASAVPGGKFASAEALALYRANALDASVKAALEHGLSE
jgi:3'-5' exoribonuclease